MSALQDISKLLEAWREYTEAEANAIQSGAWPSLQELQQAKAGLQRSITAALERWSGENKGNPANPPADHPFRAEVNRLISLEARNSQSLSVKCRAALAKKKSQERAIRNLRQVRRSYGRTPEAGWHSFS